MCQVLARFCDDMYVTSADTLRAPDPACLNVDGIVSVYVTSWTTETWRELHAVSLFYILLSVVVLLLSEALELV